MESENEKQQTVENSFEMEIEASYTLNFLIYIQNVYLNQNKEDFKFPYLSKKLLFKKDFEKHYIELWDEVTEDLAKGDVSADIKYFYDERELFYQRLLENNIENMMIFFEVYEAFQTWWDSFIGKFTLERSVEEDARKLYIDLENWLLEEGKNPAKRLCIHLIYDECELSIPDIYPYFVIVPIQTFSIRQAELTPLVQKSLI